MKAWLFILASIWPAMALTIPARAQTGWSPLVESRGLGRGTIVCDNDGTGPSSNYLCLALRCKSGKPLEFLLIAEGGNFGDGRPLPVMVNVDGRKVGLLSMQPTHLVGQKQAIAPYDPKAHQPLLTALRSGKHADLSLSGTTIRLPLRESSPQIDRVLALCRAPVAPVAKAMAGHAPLSASDIRQQIIGKRLAWGDSATIYLPNGRFEGALGGRANNGSYTLESDGRLCWRGFPAQGCFRFYRQNNALWVKRDDARSQMVLGEVTVQDRN